MDSYANWLSENPVIPSRQLCFVQDAGGTGRPLIKFGNGVNTFSDLPYLYAKNNFEATSAPAVTNDVDEFYDIGSLWSDITTPASPLVYICTDASVGAAVWVQINVGGGGGGGLVDSVGVGSGLLLTGTAVDPIVNLNSATQASLVKANTALQPGDDISELANDVGYITEVSWGDIIGTLADQTDLSAALALKLENITGLIEEGTNVTITGTGTALDPYIINVSSGGGESLTQTLLIGNITDGLDIVFSDGDIADFSNAGLNRDTIVFPSGTKIRHVAGGVLSWYSSDIEFLTQAGVSKFALNNNGSLQVGSNDIGGSIIVMDASSDFGFTILQPNITASRSETKPDADVDWTAGAGEDNYVMKYDDSTKKWSAEVESGGGSGGQVNTVVGTTDEIDVDSGDPINPVLSLATAVTDSLALADSALQAAAITNMVTATTDFTTADRLVLVDATDRKVKQSSVLVSDLVTKIANIQSIIIASSDETTDLETGLATTFRMPYGFKLTGLRASLTTASTGANLIVDVKESGTTILSTLLSIDATEKTSTTAATPVVISDSDLADDAEMTISITQIGSTIAGAGLKVTLIGYKV